ncbi:MAG TPA: DUF1552 domain-containing protein [Polyangiaceae bacterium]|nr:DUF1552 domain-containing protein [Polyangiaceae bacterium]
MISRRLALRGTLGGALFCLGLPLFEEMLNGHGTALAQGIPLPKRYGLFFWGEGLPANYRHNATTDNDANQNVGLQSDNQDFWTPTAVGKAWPLTELLTPLAAHKDNINVVTGTAIKTVIPPDPPGQNDGHQRGTIVALTADRPRSEGFDLTSRIAAVQRPSLDQFIATYPGFYSDGPPSFKSLELGMGEAFLAPQGQWIAASHNGPNLLNLPIRDPKKLFDYVFAVPPSSEDAARRVSVLDAVLEDSQALMQKLGARDKQRLDEHLTHLRDIEQRVKNGQGSCTVPPEPEAFPDRPFGADTGGADVAGETMNMDKLDMIGDVLMAALRCDLTRVFTVLFTPPGSLITMNAAGEVNGPGAIQTHDAAHQNNHDILMALTKYHMTAFAMLLDKLAAEVDVNGQSLLDSSCIFGTSEFGEGFRHSVLEMPLILAGRAGGALDTGWHVRDDGGNYCKAHYTILRAMGLNVDSYGFSGAETSDALPFLQT